MNVLTWPLLAAMVMGSSVTAGAATITGKLDTAGVVWVSDGSHPAPTSGTLQTQKGKAFLPDLSIITAGSTVQFRNDDDVDHSVYSISPADPFDLGIYEPGPGKDVAFPTAGVVDVRCHIHRRMRATLIVVDGPYARVDTPGAWTIGAVRPGRHVVHTWTFESGESVRTLDVR